MKIKELESREVTLTGDDMQKWTETKANLNAGLEKVKTEMGDLDRFVGENRQDMQVKVKDSIEDLREKCNSAADKLKAQIEQLREQTPVPPAPMAPAPMGPAPMAPSAPAPAPGQ
jgi:gas vesicle protein